MNHINRFLAVPCLVIASLTLALSVHWWPAHAQSEQALPEQERVVKRVTPLAADKFTAQTFAPNAPAATFTVTTLADSGAGSLRQAMLDANANGAGLDTIDFQGLIGTVNLESALPVITGDVRINGTGANLLTVRRNTGGDYRIFQINGGASVDLTGLTISNGSVPASEGGGIHNSGVLTITNCAITGNLANGGGGIRNLGTLVILGSTISGNIANFDGAALNNEGYAELSNSTISGNTANSSGVILNINFGGSTKTLVLVNCTVTANNGLNVGGIATVDHGGTAETYLRNTIVANNSAPNLLKIGTDASVLSQGNNLASDNGTGLLTQPSDKINTNPQLLPLGYYGGATQTHALLATSPAVDAGTNVGAPTNDQRGFARGADGNGDGTGAFDIGAYEIRPKFINAVTGNNANSGATLAAPLQTIARGIFLANDGDDLVIAAGVYFENTLIINKSINLQGAHASTTTVNAGGVNRVFQINSDPLVSGITVGISNLTITNGNTTASGGGILSYGTLNLAYCIVTGNTAPSGYGGGIHSDNNSLLNISHSTISNNSANQGGGIQLNTCCLRTGTLKMSNSTISGNTAFLTSGGLGMRATTAVLTNSTITSNNPSGIFNRGVPNDSTGNLLLNNCTVTANQDYGVITQHDNGATNVVTQLKNTLVAGNGNTELVGFGASPTITSLGNNLTDDNGSGYLTGPGDLINTNPMLASLDNNGGPTKTHLLQAGSPAINAGSNVGAPSTDQRGTKRPIGANADIGAVEVAAASCSAIAIGPGGLPDGLVGVFYSQQLTATGGTGPYVFSETSSFSLPAGLSVSSSGIVSGITTQTGATSFTVNVLDQNGCLSTRTILLSIVSNICNANTPMDLGQTINGQLQASDCASFFPNKFTDFYTFSGTAGQQIAISLSSPNFDTLLYLYRDTTLINSDDDGGGGTNSRIPANSGFLTLPTTATYRIVVTSFGNGETGNTTVTLAGLCPVTLTPVTRNLGATTTSSSVNVTAGCAWTATSNTAWLTLTGATTGTGNGTVNYNVAANTGASRTGTITVNGVTHTVFQATSNTTQDSDNDGIPDSVEITEGRNPQLKDNDIFTSNPTSNRLFVMQQYRDFLGREGDPGGITNWVNNLNANALTRAQVIESFFNSAEFQNTGAPIVRLYFACFLRIPDYAGLQNWITAYRGGMPLETIANFFVTSPEFLQTYGNLNNTQFVTLVYNNVLGRAPDPTGLANWVNALNNGMPRGTLMVNFSESQEYKNRIGNSVYVTMMYVGMLRRSPDQTGFNNWVAYLGAGNSGLALINGFIGAQEYRNRFLP